METNLVSLKVSVVPVGVNLPEIGLIKTITSSFTLPSQDIAVEEQTQKTRVVFTLEYKTHPLCPHRLLELKPVWGTVWGRLWNLWGLGPH